MKQQQQARLLHWLFVLLLAAVALLLRVLDLGGILTVDEATTWVPNSYRFLRVLQSGDYANTPFMGHPAITTMWLGSAGVVLRRLLFDWGVLVHETFPLVLALNRLPVPLVTVAGLLAGYGMLRRMVPALVAGLAVFLWATDPFLIAFSRVLHMDALMATFATLALLTALYYWNYERRMVWLVLSAICTGLAILSKLPSFVLFPIVTLIGLTGFTHEPHTAAAEADAPARPIARFGAMLLPRLKVAVPHLLLWGFLSGLTVVALWPTFWTNPVRAYEALRYGVAVEGGSPHLMGNFFMGQPTDAPGVLFYPVALAMRTTPWTLIGLFLLPIALRSAQRRAQQQTAESSESSESSDPYDLPRLARNLAMLAGWCVLFVLAMSIFPLKFNRYLIPIFPAIDILAATGLLLSVPMVQAIILRSRGLPAANPYTPSSTESSRERENAPNYPIGANLEPIGHRDVSSSPRLPSSPDPFSQGTLLGNLYDPGSAGGSPAPGRGLAPPNPYLITPPFTIKVLGEGGSEIPPLPREEGPRSHPFPPDDSVGKPISCPDLCGFAPLREVLPGLYQQSPGGGRGRRKGGANLPAALLAVFIASLSLLNAAWYHPYSIVYFNQLLGGAQAGARTFLIGWGEGMDQVSDWLNQQPDITSVVTVSRMSLVLNPYLKDLAQAYRSDGARLPEDAGYMTIYARHTQWDQLRQPYSEVHGRQPPLHVVNLHGVDYAWIYQLPKEMPEPLHASFGPSIELHGYGLDTMGLQSSGMLNLTLQWYADSAIPADYALFVHVFDRQGEQIGQLDVPLRDQRHGEDGQQLPTSEWQPGRYFLWLHEVPVQTSEPEEIGWISLGVYDPATFARLPLQGPAQPAGAPDDGANALFLGR